MAERRKKLSLKHDRHEGEAPEVDRDASSRGSDSDTPRYHLAHDPELVADDEIPW